MGGERSILYKGVETSPYQICFKNFKGKPERENLKRIMSDSGELGLLQMVSESDTMRCVSEKAEPPMGVMGKPKEDNIC